MPSKSLAQARLMAASAHDPGFAKRVGVPQSAATEFNRADQKSGILRKHKFRKPKPAKADPAERRYPKMR